jgi:hypothetical protein
MEQQVQQVRRQRRRGMSDLQVAALRKKAKRYIVKDPELRGRFLLRLLDFHCVRLADGVPHLIAVAVTRHADEDVGTDRRNADVVIKM